MFWHSTTAGKGDGTLVDPRAIQRDILPLIKEIPLCRLQHATGLSLRYVSLIRRGERTPHPQHWQALLAAVMTPETQCVGRIELNRSRKGRRKAPDGRGVC
jgi:hypothetical protein